MTTRCTHRTVETLHLQDLMNRADRLLVDVIDRRLWATVEAAAPRAWIAGSHLIEAGQRDADAVVQPLGYVLALDAIIAAGVEDYATEAAHLRAALVAADPTLTRVP